MTKFQELNTLVESAADACEVPFDDILFKESRARKLADCRNIICHIAARVVHIQVTRLVLAQFTGRGHPSTTYNSIQKAQDLLFYDRDFQRKYKTVVNKFNEQLLNATA